MRVSIVDGLVTLFYDGSKPLWNEELDREWFNKHMYSDFYRKNDFNDHWENWDLSTDCKRYWRERQSWQQIIIVNGVTEIPERTFSYCKNIKRVIMADTVVRIEERAFKNCTSLVFIKWSINLEYMGESAFECCNLSCVFVPPRCRVIEASAFYGNRKLEMFNVQQNVQLRQPNRGVPQPSNIIGGTALRRKFPNYLRNLRVDDLEIYVWLKNINNGDKFALHRVCASYNPTLDLILNTMKEKGGPKAFKVENSIGITPSRYLKENPYANVSEKEVIEKYLLQMMGELQSDQEVF